MAESEAKKRAWHSAGMGGGGGADTRASYTVPVPHEMGWAVAQAVIEQMTARERAHIVAML